jgi:rhodanese-related sulfurtransferase
LGSHWAGGEGEQPSANGANQTPERNRHADLSEAAKLLTVDVRNSAEWASHYLQANNITAFLEAHARTIDKFKAAHALLAEHIENLPTL